MMVNMICKPFRWLTIVVIMGIGFPINAALVGDFAPIQLGNQWVFSRLDTSLAGWKKGMVKLEVVSVFKSENRISYAIQKSDSTYDGAIGNFELDTLIESSDGKIVSKGFFPYLKQHTYEDSLIREQEVDGQPIQVVKDGNGIYYKDRGLGEIDTTIVLCDMSPSSSTCWNITPIQVKIRLLKISKSTSAIRMSLSSRLVNANKSEINRFDLLGRALEMGTRFNSNRINTYSR